MLGLLQGAGMLASSVMERTELLKRLEQQLVQEMEQVTRQRELLTDLVAKGVEIEPARMLLGRLENLLVFHLQERQNLRVQLDRMTGGAS
jgi:hypothetical protein